MDATFLQARITSLKERIVAAEEAQLAILSGAIQSFTLNTGQTQQTINKLNLSKLQDAINSLYNQCGVLEARLTGSGTITVGPGF